MEMSQLWGALASGDPRARDQLASAHLNLVRHVALRVSRAMPRGPEFDDLLSAGTLGLMSAIDSFDLGRGLSFSTFAVPRIRGAILDELRRVDRVPRSVRQRQRAMAAARSRLTERLGRQPEDDEMAHELGIDRLTYWRWHSDAATSEPISIDRPARAGADDDAARALSEVLSASDGDDVETRLTREQEVELLRDAILRLRPRERSVLALYYYEELRMHEIAEVLQVTESRVSQIRTAALASLREALRPMREGV